MFPPRNSYTTNLLKPVMSNSRSFIQKINVKHSILYKHELGKNILLSDINHTYSRSLY